MCHVCVRATDGKDEGRDRDEFRDDLERMMGLVELEVMLCIAVDFNAHVGVVEPGEEGSVW